MDAFVKHRLRKRAAGKTKIYTPTAEKKCAVGGVCLKSHKRHRMIGCGDVTAHLKNAAAMRSVRGVTPGIFADLKRLKRTAEQFTERTARIDADFQKFR